MKTTYLFFLSLSKPEHLLKQCHLTTRRHRLHKSTNQERYRRILYPLTRPTQLYHKPTFRSMSLPRLLPDYIPTQADKIMLPGPIYHITQPAPTSKIRKYYLLAGILLLVNLFGLSLPQLLS
ncbi:hypothetical protein DSUL_60176 [Desulfovibrionales bacterium]